MVFTADNHILQGLLLGAIGLLASGCARHTTPPPPKPAVTVVDLHATPVSLTTELPGRVSAYRIAEVRPQVNGVILKRLFKEGDLVAEGQQLYQIDPAPYEAALASARATLAHARASVVAARLTEERYQALSEARAVSRQDYDNAVATLEQDEADVASGEAAVRTAEINLAYTKVYSPISGRTGRSSVTEGALVTANQAMSLLKVTQLDPVYVDLTEPSATLVQLERELAAGQIRHVDGHQAPVKLLLEDGSPYESAGTLEFSEVTVDEGTGSVTGSPARHHPRARWHRHGDDRRRRRQGRKTQRRARPRARGSVGRHQGSRRRRPTHRRRHAKGKARNGGVRPPAGDRARERHAALEARTRRTLTPVPTFEGVSWPDSSLTDRSSPGCSPSS